MYDMCAKSADRRARLARFAQCQISDGSFPLTVENLPNQSRKFIIRIIRIIIIITTIKIRIITIIFIVIIRTIIKTMAIIVVELQCTTRGNVSACKR